VSDIAERHRRACELFTELVELEREARAERLEAIVANDAELGRELTAMLEADDGALGAVDAIESLIASAMAPIVAEGESLAAEADPLVGTTMGGFRIERLIAAGGMGRVYEARQGSPNRLVAIKLSDLRIRSRAALARFRNEAEVMARLVHPGIAQIYEVGTQQEQQGSAPWFAMELVPNAMSVVDAAQARSLGTRARVELLLAVCDAIHFGHCRGIIHRDIKPSNVLVDASAAVLHPKIIDFGIARSTDSDIAVATQRTEIGQLVGTLQYMSPEQLAGDSSAIDVRTDVYALGLLLYELLTGQPAFDVGGLAVHQAISALSTVVPKRMRDVVPHRAADVGGDLQTILSKAIERDIARRYATVHDFAEELRRYLHHEPISARPASAVYTVRLFARRHRALVWGAVATIVALALGLVGTSFGLLRAMESERAAVAARDQAEFDAYVANVVAAEAAIRTKDIALARERLDAAPAVHRGWEWRHLNAEIDRSLARSASSVQIARATCASPDGSTVVFGDLVGMVRAFDVATLAERWSHKAPRELTDVAFSPDGTRVAVVADSTEVQILDAATGSVIASRPVKGARIAHFEGDGQHLLIAKTGGTSERWRIGTEELTPHGTVEHRSATNDLMYPEAISPDGVWMVLDRDGDARLTRVVDGEVVSRFGLDAEPTRRLQYSRASFSSDGRWLAIEVVAERLVFRDLLTGTERSAFIDELRATSLAWHPSEPVLFLGGDNGALTAFDAATARPLRALLGHTPPVCGIAGAAANPASEHASLVSIDYSGIIRRWDPETSDVLRHQTNRAWVYSLAFSPDGSWFATSSGERPSGDPMVAMFDTRSGHRRWASPPLEPSGIIGAVDFSDDGMLVVHDKADNAVVRSAATGETQGTELTARSSKGWRGATFRPGHREVLLTVDDGKELFSIADGRMVRRFVMRNRNEQAMSADGAWLALSPRPETGVEIVSIDDGTRLAALDTESSVWSMSFSFDGRWLAARCEDGAVMIWATADWKLRRSWPGDGFNGNHIAFEPGGRLLGIVHNGLRVWDVEQGRELVTLPARADTKSKIAVSDNGEWAGVGCTDGSVLLFDAPQAKSP
jgi:WD40 repeat protein